MFGLCRGCGDGAAAHREWNLDVDSETEAAMDGAGIGDMLLRAREDLALDEEDLRRLELSLELAGVDPAGVPEVAYLRGSVGASDRLLVLLGS